MPSTTGTRSKKKLTDVQKLRGKIRLALDQMMQDVRVEIDRNNQTSGEYRFRRGEDLSAKMRHYLEVSEKLESLGLIPKFYTQNKG